MNCENCAHAYDEGYQAGYNAYLGLRDAMLSLIEECNNTLAWRAATGMRPATDTSMFASSPPSAVINVRRALIEACGRDTMSEPLSAEEMEGEGNERTRLLLDGCS